MRRFTAQRASRLLLPARLNLQRPLFARSASVAVASGVAAAGLGWTFTSSTTIADCKAASPPRFKAAAEADRLFDANKYDAAAALLRAEIAARPSDPEALWRLARALKKLADAVKAKSPEQEGLVREGLGCAEKAITADATCGPAHKWYAILLSQVGTFGGTTATIKNSFVVREHFERAVELCPTDATSRHLLGLWCYEVAKLSWIERQAASALFAAPPKATFEEAFDHFEAAETMDPNFYPKNLMLLAQAAAKIGKSAEAKDYLSRCLAAKAATPEDEETLKEAKKLKL